MDKKSKKRLEVLKQRRLKLEQQLAGAKKQMDDPDEVTRLQRDLEMVNEEVTKIKSG